MVEQADTASLNLAAFMALRVRLPLWALAAAGRFDGTGLRLSINTLTLS
jgi:hypothetical protein